MHNINPLIFSKLGFTNNQVSLYIGFLENPNKTIAQVAKVIKMDKSSAYKASIDLINWGLLIPYPQTKGTIYKIGNPKILEDIYQEKLDDIKNVKINLDNIIHNLKNYKNERSAQIKVESGLEAHLKSMENSLKIKNSVIKEIFNLNTSIFKVPAYNDYVLKFVKRRLKQNISIKQLEVPARHKPLSSIMKTTPNLLKEIRQLPSEISSNNNIRIFEPKTIEILSFDLNQEFLVITIKDPFIVEMFTSFFDYIWKRSKEIHKM